MKGSVALRLPEYGVAGALAGMAFVVTLVLVVSCLFHIFVEKKVILYLNGFRNPKKAVPNLAADGTA